ncbi:hypothetical protein BRD56_07830 [Thermoplasmatales archaeon SW_10_69_26]|nr:MAG: hypothetical protein BRD56_07830 [Thermoplasmatales archaeon SW_10_69_26]
MANFRILRERLRIDHTGPRERSLQIQYEIQNTSDEHEEEVFLILDEYLPGLQVTTGSGKELAYLPDEMVEDRVGDQEEFIRDAVGEDIFEEGDFEDARILLVELEDPLPPNEVFVLKLNHLDAVSPPQGRGLIRQPRFEVSEAKGHEGHDTFIEIRGPDRSLISPDQEQGDPDFTALDGYLQAKAEGGAGLVSFQYEVRPRAAEKVLVRSFFLALTLLPVIVLTAAGVFQGGPWKFTLLGEQMGIFSPQQRLRETLGAVGLTGTIALMGLTRPRWVQRLYFLLPLVLYLALILWRFSP